MNIRLLIFLLTLVATNASFAQLLVFSYFSSEPEFVGLQYKAFRKFLPKHRYIVFNDAFDKKDRTAIKLECKRHDIECINVPKTIHKISYPPLPQINQKLDIFVRKAVTLQFALEKLGYKHDDILMLVDPRVLPIRHLNIDEFMHDTDVATVFKSFEQLDYMWPGLTILNMNQIPNRFILTFDFNDQNSTVGGYTHYYLAAHTDLRVKQIDIINGSKLLCPYNIPFNPTQDINNDTNSNMPSEEHKRSLEEMGFNKREIIFFAKKPVNIDLFLDGRFLYYRGYSPYKYCADFINSLVS